MFYDEFLLSHHTKPNTEMTCTYYCTHCTQLQLFILSKYCKVGKIIWQLGSQDTVFSDFRLTSEISYPWILIIRAGRCRLPPRQISCRYSRDCAQPSATRFASTVEPRTPPGPPSPMASSSASTAVEYTGLNHSQWSWRGCCTMINRLKIYHHTYQPGGHNIIHATSLFTQQLTTQNVISDSLVIYIR